MSRLVGPLAGVALVSSFVAAARLGRRSTRLAAAVVAVLAVAALWVVGPWPMAAGVLVVLCGMFAVMAGLDGAEAHLRRSRRLPVCESCASYAATQLLEFADESFAVCSGCASPSVKERAA